MNWSRHLLWTAPLLILITQLPIFLQSSLTPDTVLYDLQARCLLNGGVLYRDIVEPNLPGVVWVHAVVRTCVGDSSVALRIFDLMVLGGICFLLQSFIVGGFQEPEKTQVARSFVMSLLLLFYLSTSEWCHCQRDTWMLLPSLAAMWLRVLACERSVCGRHGHDFTLNDAASEPEPATGDLRVCFLEGTLWAVGFWLKPFVAVPAIAVLAVSCMFVPSRKIAAQQIGTVLAGGLCVGLAGIYWMMRTGCWVPFVDMLTSWNADYFQAGRSRWTSDRYIAHAQRFFPWIILHLPAIAIAGRAILRAIQNRGTPLFAVREGLASLVLQAGYLGWLLQAFAFQQLFDYIHVPGIMLALAVCVQAGAFMFRTANTRAEVVNVQPFFCHLCLPLATAFVAVALLNSPATVWSRQRHWYRCLQACTGSKLEPQVKDQIALTPMPRWQELQPVMDKLSDLCDDDVSVLAYNGNLIHLYPAMSFQPPTRFVYVDVLARCFPRRRPEMLTAIENSKAEYVVSDLVEDGWAAEVWTAGRSAADGSASQLSTTELLPKALALQSNSLFFPYNQTPVFRSGGYVIFRINKPLGWLTHEYSPLDQGRLLQLTGAASAAAKE